MLKRSKFVLGACGSAGLATLLLAIATAPAAAKPTAVAKPTHRAVTTVTVTAGKPAELAFKFSKISFLPTGTVVFKVTNAGKIVHDFKVCSVPSSTAFDTCTGKVTRRLKPGQTASLPVVFKFEGTYEFLCSVPGHATGGMKGLLGVGVAAPKQKAAASSTPVSAAKTTTNPSTTKPCASPVSSTVNVEEYDFGFRVSPSSVPCGTITFRQTNTGNVVHDFVIPNVARGDRINGGQSTTMTATVGPGTYSYLCTVEGHDTLGMVGSLTVTG
jgi:uncharacterized cupredoxin-like copper-binding protein